MKLKAFNHIWVCLDWIVFLILTSCAIYSVSGIWDSYNTQKTSLDVEEQPINKHPTITICSGRMYLETARWIPFTLGIHFNVTIYPSVQR